MSDLAAVLAPFEDSPPDDQIAVLCHLVAQGMSIAEDELNGAIRRAQLLLATGGDPRRRLELDGRAVTALADDLDTPQRREALMAGLDSFAANVVELPALRSTLERLRADRELAWRGLCVALLADSVG
jgi:hypothetical protein